MANPVIRFNDSGVKQQTKTAVAHQEKTFPSANIMYTDLPNLPTTLSRNAIIYTTDTGELFVGSGDGLKPVTNKALEKKIDDLQAAVESGEGGATGAAITEDALATLASKEELGEVRELAESKADAEAVYTKEEVDNKVSTIPKFSFEVVDTLPPVEDAPADKIYLVRASEEDEGNVYTEYIVVNNSYEKLGIQKFDLSGYATVEDVNNIDLSAYATKSEIPDVSGFANKNDVYTKEEVNQLVADAIAAAKAEEPAGEPPTEEDNPPEDPPKEEEPPTVESPTEEDNPSENPPQEEEPPKEEEEPTVEPPTEEPSEEVPVEDNKPEEVPTDEVPEEKPTDEVEEDLPEKEPVDENPTEENPPTE